MNADMECSAESAHKIENGNTITIKFYNALIETPYGSTYVDSVEITSVDGVQKTLVISPCYWFVVSQQSGRMISERISDLMACEVEE